jgi:CHAD domain-containing protein
MIFPATVLQSEIDALVGYLPAVRDGDSESVHSARVVTRRLREALPLFARSYPADVRRLKSIVRHVGRRLGRVRELDVMDDDLGRRGGRLPVSLHAIAAARIELQKRRDAARRRLIKALDRCRLDSAGRLALHHRRDWWRVFDNSQAAGWADLLRRRIAERADEVGRAMDHAGGVYFPNRLHAVRVAVKKLRYSAELATEGGLGNCTDAIAGLRRVQDTLGRIHDAQVVLDSLERLTRRADVSDRETEIVKDDLRGEIAERHAKYLLQREPLRAACHACWRAVERTRRRSPIPPAIAISAVAFPAGLFMLGAREG